MSKVSLHSYIGHSNWIVSLVLSNLINSSPSISFWSMKTFAIFYPSSSHSFGRKWSRQNWQTVYPQQGIFLYYKFSSLYPWTYLGICFKVSKNSLHLGQVLASIWYYNFVFGPFNYITNILNFRFSNFDINNIKLIIRFLCYISH